MPSVTSAEPPGRLSLAPSWRGTRHARVGRVAGPRHQGQRGDHTFQKKIGECDQRLQAHYQSMESKADPKKLPPYPREKRPHGNVPKCFDLRSKLLRTTGVDLTAIDGINVLTAQTVISEVSYNMGRFDTEGQGKRGTPRSDGRVASPDAHRFGAGCRSGTPGHRPIRGLAPRSPAAETAGAGSSRRVP